MFRTETLRTRVCVPPWHVPTQGPHGSQAGSATQSTLQLPLSAPASSFSGGMPTYLVSGSMDGSFTHLMPLKETSGTDCLENLLYQAPDAMQQLQARLGFILAWVHSQPYG